MKDIILYSIQNHSKTIDNNISCELPVIAICEWSVLQKSTEPYLCDMFSNPHDIFQGCCNHFRNLVVEYLEKKLELDLLKVSNLDRYHYIRADIEYSPDKHFSKRWKIIVPVIDIYNRASIEKKFIDSPTEKQINYIRTLARVEIRKQVNQFMKNARDFEVS